MHARSHDMTSQVAAFAADGALPPIDQADSFHLTAQNLAGNKLDYYLDTSLDLSGSIEAGKVGDLRATVVLSNTAPVGATSPAYVFGPGPTSVSLPAGVLRSVVTLYLPFGTSVDGSSGGPLVEPVVSGTEAGRPFVSFTVDVPAGAERQVDISLTTAPRPTSGYSFLVIPSPRVRPTTLGVDVSTDAGTVRGAVELQAPWVFEAGRTPYIAKAPAFR
jgi:hypothetical protein